MSSYIEELPHALQSPDCFSVCPNMDLVSFQLSDTVMWIYRKGTEKVWDIDLNDLGETDGRISKMQWRSDGNLFAIATDDHIIAQYDTKKGNLVTCLKLQKSIAHMVWDTYMVSQARIEAKDIIRKINVLDALPALNSLSSNKSVSTIFLEGSDLVKSEKVNDMILAVMEDNTFSFILGGLFVVEDLRSSHSNFGKILHILSKPDLSSHAFLAENSSAGGELVVAEIKTPFVTGNEMLTKILSICIQLMEINDFFKKVVDQIDNQFKPYIDYTIRIVELLRGEIKEDEEAQINDENLNGKPSIQPENVGSINSTNTDPVYDLYDLLLTGSLSNSTKKWLTDYLGDRGIKRWSTLGSKYFESARELIFNEIITALHHTIVGVTNLKGLLLTNSENCSEYLDLVEKCLSSSQEYLEYTYKLIIKLNEEERHFNQTIGWLSSILNKITSDEKINETFKTNDITKYLIFISSKLNYVGIEDSPDNTVRHSKLNEFTASLDLCLSNFFEKIRNEVKYVTIGNPVKLSHLHEEGQTIENIHFDCFRLFYEYHYFAYQVLRTEVKLSVIQCGDLNTKYNLVMNPEDEEPIIDAVIVDCDTIVILFENSVKKYYIHLPSGKHILKDTIIFGLQPNGSKFQAGNLTVNQRRNMCCILDKSKKKYMWWSI